MLVACAEKGIRRGRLNPEDRLAGQLVGRIDELFAVDAEARAAGMDHGARHVLRQERSRPLLETMKKEMEAARAAVLPASALGKGVSYTLSLWDSREFPAHFPFPRK